MTPTFFETPEAFRAWLEANHASAPELLVGYWKVGSGRPSMTWPQSVDQALCFGWIDGVRRSIDAESYSIRFTPRKPGGVWSRINIAKFEALEAAGLMTPAGRAAFERGGPARTDRYSFENPLRELTPEELEGFQANSAAWADWQARPASYRKAALHWIHSAKRPETRARRLTTLIEDSAQGRKIALLKWDGRSK